MAEKPPAWTNFNQAGQVPLMLSRDVDTSKVHPASGQDPHILAEQMVRSQQSNINRFVSQQRQQIEIAGKDIHTARLPLNGLEVYYTHVQGLERMHYHVQPEAEAPGVPVNKPEKIPEFEITHAKVPEPEIPKPPKFPEPEGTPDWIYFSIPGGLAVVFGDGAHDPP